MFSEELIIPVAIIDFYLLIKEVMKLKSIEIFNLSFRDESQIAWMIRLTANHKDNKWSQ